MPRTSDKKQRLVKAAKDLIHKQGYSQTSLADIADDSGVPLGNVYYYFRTKVDIASAVIAEHQSSVKGLLSGIDDAESNPRQRLYAYIDFIISMKETAASYGCPIGSLCQELDKDRSSLSEQVDSVVQTQLDWTSIQFKHMGVDKPVELAQFMIATMHGTSLLANSLNDADVVETQLNRLKDWIEQI